jgi:peptidoglycan/xylan/chitin deacetylase (PgdA/CDA1 family)
MSTSQAVSSGGWGPRFKRAAVSVSFDNLGEACDIAMGKWPPGQPIGRHFTATEVLPRLLRELEGIQATYFIEASNFALYPEQILAWHDAGHEIGLHAWQHENWSRLDLAQQRINLVQSLAAMATLGVRPQGFRPPGGAISDPSLALLKELGFQYCSPLAHPGRGTQQDGVVLLPFVWKHVDAYLCDPALAGFRQAQGDPAEPASAQQWSTVLEEAIADALARGSHLTVIFHPYMIGRDEGLNAAMRSFLQAVRSNRDIWLAPCHEVAQSYL